jgi:DNA-directed RNA polymerase specialized sigma24 family protein
MNAAPRPDGRWFPDPLEAFRVKLLAVLDGRHPVLTPVERMWLAAFRVAASRSARRLNEDESFDLSLSALVRCRRKGRDGCYAYVLRACRNAHRNHLRGLRRPPRVRPREGGHDPWAGVDARIDLEDALARMRALNRTSERAVLLRRLGYTFAEIGAEFGVGAKGGERITVRAERCLRRILGGGYDGSL